MYKQSTQTTISLQAYTDGEMKLQVVESYLLLSVMELSFPGEVHLGFCRIYSYEIRHVGGYIFLVLYPYFSINYIRVTIFVVCVLFVVCIIDY